LETVLERTAPEPETEEMEEILLTHLKIQENHSYELLTHQPGFARVRLLTRHVETIDESSYLYEPALFSCANFCAVVAVNEKENHIISAKVDFLNPVKSDDDEIIFEATATTNSSGKKQIDVIGTVKGIVVLESSFVSLKLDKKSLLKESSKKAKTE